MLMALTSHIWHIKRYLTIYLPDMASPSTSLMLSDRAVLAEVGRRLAAHRLRLNLTQTQLAKQAGVAPRTLVRLEHGEASQLGNLVRVMRALGLLESVDSLVPEPLPSPLQLLKLRGKQRRRASGTRGGGQSGPKNAAHEGEGGRWVWGDEGGGGRRSGKAGRAGDDQ